MEPKTIARSEAIALLRQKCMTLVDDEHSLCQVAAKLKILCGGFAQWTFAELKERHEWIVRRRPHITRKELEDLANRWQLARQFARDERLPCDVQMGNEAHHLCHGWDDFSDEQLAHNCRELTGEELNVVPDPLPSVGAER